VQSSQGDKLGQFRHPIGLAFDSKKRLFVSEYGNHRIQLFTVKGQPLGSFGKFGRGEGEFEKSCDLDIDINDKLYVVDSGNHRIQVFKIH